MKMPEKSNKFWMLIFVLIALLVFLSWNYQVNINSKSALKSEVPKNPEAQKAFDNISVLARSFSVYDQTDEKEIYSRSGDTILPLASLSKIMTVVLALGKYRLDDVITISKNYGDAYTNNSLFFGERWKVLDLAKFTLISSSNDGAYALAMNDPNFLSEMNIKAKQIGMKNSNFLDFTGLDLNAEQAGSYGTALDVNLLAIYAMENYPFVFRATILPEITLQSESGFIHNVYNTDTITASVPNLLFSKTGYTVLAGGNLTVIFRNNSGHIIAITLLGSTKDGRFSDMEKLVGIAYNL